MSNLVEANLFRFYKKPIYWGCLLILAGNELLYYIAEKNGTVNASTAESMYFFMQMIEIILAALLSILLDAEHTDGTLRNKVIAGYSRMQIYLSFLGSATIGISLIYLTSALTGLATGIMGGGALGNISEMILSGISGWLICIVNITLFVAISLCTQVKSMAIFSSLITAFLLMMLGLGSYQMLTAPEYFSVSFFWQKMIRMIVEINPQGQILEIINGNTGNMVRKMIYMIIESIILSVSGLLLFQHKNLK